MGSPTPFASRTGAVPGPSGGLRVTPTTDTGWAAYSAGSRLFLPAATNEYKNPRLIENGATGWPSFCSDPKNVTGTPVPDVLPNGDGTYYHELVYTILAGDVGLSSKNFGVYASTADGDLGAFAAADPATLALEYQLVVSNARSCTAGRAVIYNQAYAGGVTTATSPTSEWVRVSATNASLPAGTTGLMLYFLADVLATCVAGDTITLRWRYMGVVKSTVLTPHFDGSMTGCTWSSTADASTSVRAASNLVLTAYVTITSAGAVAAGTKVAYVKNPSGTYYGPGVITDTAKSAGWQTDFDAESDLNVIWGTLIKGDLLLPTVSDGVGWVKR